MVKSLFHCQCVLLEFSKRSFLFKATKPQKLLDIFLYRNGYSVTPLISVKFEYGKNLYKTRLLNILKVLTTCADYSLPKTYLGFSADALGRELCTRKVQFLGKIKFHAHSFLEMAKFILYGGCTYIYPLIKNLQNLLPCHKGI